MNFRKLLARLLRRGGPAEEAICGATMTGTDQNGMAINAGPCVLSPGHVADDGRPDAHCDGRTIWGGE